MNMEALTANKGDTDIKWVAERWCELKILEPLNLLHSLISWSRNGHQLPLNIRLSALSVVFSVAEISILLFGVALGGVRHAQKLLEQGRRLTPGFALLCGKKPSLSIVRTTHLLYSSRQRTTFMRLKTTYQLTTGMETGPIPGPEKVLSYCGSGCHTNVVLDSSTR